MPSANDLSIARLDRDTLAASSHLTKGRCAVVFLQQSQDDNMLITPTLIPAYMQGLDASIIHQAAKTFLEIERTNPCQ